MSLYIKMIKAKLPLSIITGGLYLGLLLIMIRVFNNDSVIAYPINPYEYGSEPVDFFFALIVSLP